MEQSKQIHNRSNKENTHQLEQVLSQYEIGKVREVLPMTAGNTSQVWKVDTTEGSWVVRTLKHAQQGEVEYELNAHICKKSNITPLILSTRSNQPYVQVEDTCYNLQIHHDSVPFPVGELDSISNVGRVVGILHRSLKDFSCPVQVFDRFDLATLWKSAKPLWQHVKNEVTDANVNVKHVEMCIKELVQKTTEHRTTDHQSTVYHTHDSWIHGDLGIWNLLYRTGDVKIIDFGEARSGNVLFDVAAAMTSAIGFTSDEETTHRKMAHFLKAYESEMSPVDREELQKQVNLWFLRGVLAALVCSSDEMPVRMNICTHFLRARAIYTNQM